MEENDRVNPRQAPDSQRSGTTSPTPSPLANTRQATPSENDLAHALLTLSVAERATPTPAPQAPSSSIPGSCPDTPLPQKPHHVLPPSDDAFLTPIRDPRLIQLRQYPNLNDFESSPERDRSESPASPALLYQLPSPETTPEPSAVSKSKTLVIYHEACNKHKFSRNVKARELATIVERPERCRASLLGIAAAKTRLDIEDAIDSSFDIFKSDRLGNLSDQAVVNVHASTWPAELASLCDNALDKISKGDLEIPPPYHSGDLYLGNGSLEALRGCIGAIYDGVDRVLLGGYDRVHVSIRPPGHHCAETMPSGFCMINNVHVAISYAHSQYNIARAVILDFDLHHGDGSQAIAWAINETTNKQSASRSPRRPPVSPGLQIGYFSLHDIYSFPCEEGQIDKVRDASLCLSAHGQTIWNVHLRHHPTDAEFDKVYDAEYSVLFQRAAEFLSGSAQGEKCMVFLSAGFDASEHESKGMQRHGYNLPTSFYQRFASDAIGLADRYASGKILSVMEGGYADRAITSGSFAYMVGLSGVTEKSVNYKCREWWSVPRLMALEKSSKKAANSKMNHRTLGDNDAQWVSETLNLATLLSPSSFTFAESSIESTLPATPRMGLRERKQPIMPATAPPSAVKTRQKRVATPRTRKSIIGTEAFAPAEDVPPVPVQDALPREVSPGAELSSLMQRITIANEAHEPSDPDSKTSERSAPGTPTPVGKGETGKSIQ